MAEKFDPLHQFQISRLREISIGGVDASFTNSAVFMVVAVVAITAFMLIAVRGKALVPTRLQSMAELSYEFIANMIRENAGTAGMKYFPFIFSLFMFILFCNLIGMIPYTFTVTSHIIVTFAMALVVFIGVTVIGFARHGLHFLSKHRSSRMPALNDRGECNPFSAAPPMPRLQPVLCRFGVNER